MTAGLLICCACCLGADFRDVKIEKPFDRYLKASPLLMEVTGAKVIRLKNGNVVILGVASTVIDDDKPRTRINAERVCTARALAAIVGERDGVQVAHEEKVEDRTEIVLENGKEKGKSVSKVLSLTKTKVQGIVRGTSVVGRWRSDDGKTFYLAVGAICDKNGKPLSNEE